MENFDGSLEGEVAFKMELLVSVGNTTVEVLTLEVSTRNVDNDEPVMLVSVKVPLRVLVTETVDTGGTLEGVGVTPPVPLLKNG